MGPIQVDKAANQSGYYWLAMPANGHWRIDRVDFAPCETTPLHASNYVTCQVLVNDGLGGDDVLIASHNTSTTGGQPFVVNRTIRVHMSGSEELRTLKAGQGLKVQNVPTGAGAKWRGAYTISLTELP